MGSERRSFLGVGRKKKEQESAWWNVENAGAFSKGGGQRWETGAQRPSRQRGRFSTAVHGPAFPRRSGLVCRLRRCCADAAQQLTLGALHFQGGFGVGLELCELLECGQRHAEPEQTLAARYLLEQLERRGPPRIGTAALAVGHDDHHRHRAGAMEVDVGIQMIAVKRIDRRGVFAPMWTKPRCLRSTAPFLASTRPLSPEWWARDLVCSIQSLLRSLATV